MEWNLFFFLLAILGDIFIPLLHTALLLAGYNIKENNQFLVVRPAW